jgi:hypothetical protein
MPCHQLSKMLEDKKNSPGKNIDIPHRESSEFTREIRLNTRMFISNKIKNGMLLFFTDINFLIREGQPLQEPQLSFY